MDYFYKPYRKDMFKEQEEHMKFENKNPQWSSIADGIIGKNKKVNQSFKNAIQKYVSSSKNISSEREISGLESTIKNIRQSSKFKQR